MFRTRIIFSLGMLVLVAATPTFAPGDDFLQRDGRYIRLTTDLASPQEAETLVTSFDAAAAQWIEFWGLSAEALADWKVDACVMRNKAPFQAAGRIPQNVPDFPFGFTLDDHVWVLAQPSEYYTRHLLLHEGVHSLAYAAFRGTGPTWFQEGTAELLATHSGQGSTIKVNQIPPNREAVPYWGRFKLMKQLRDQSVVPTLATVMRYQPDLRGDVGTYGWSWAAAMMLSVYPEYRPAFMEAAGDAARAGPRFNVRIRRRLADQWPIVAARWRVMCHDLDYGFDWSREKVALSAEDPRWDGRPVRVSVAADQGWQSIGVRIPGGVRVKLTPAGRITLAETSKPWISESAGITFQYHRGRPLGQLLVCILPNAFDPEAATLQPLEIHAVDQETTLSIPRFSWLLLRVNDGVGELGDNQGAFELTVSRG